MWIISDEAYSRILFDGHSFPSPGLFHPYSMLAHTYSKSALAPGQRLGFLALAPDLPEADVVRKALLTLSAGVVPLRRYLPNGIAWRRMSRKLLRRRPCRSN
jgi:aspartate aminotransferase